MKKFEFQNNSLELDIAGHRFELNPIEDGLLERIEKMGEESKLEAERMREDNSPDSIKMGMNFMVKQIDALLGDGAANKIFEKRTINFFDVLDVLTYIKDSIIEFQSEKISKYSPNRVQRRSK